jgi:hypothetical protein
MDGVQNIIYEDLQRLADAVEEGKFGVGDNFDKDAFEAAFSDEVLIHAYVYETETEN